MYLKLFLFPLMVPSADAKLIARSSASQQPARGRDAMARRRAGWGHPAMPESRLTGHSARARRR